MQLAGPSEYRSDDHTEAEMRLSIYPARSSTDGLP